MVTYISSTYLPEYGLRSNSTSANSCLVFWAHFYEVLRANSTMSVPQPMVDFERIYLFFATYLSSIWTSIYTVLRFRVPVWFCFSAPLVAYFTFLSMWWFFTCLRNGDSLWYLAMRVAVKYLGWCDVPTRRETWPDDIPMLDCPAFRLRSLFRAVRHLDREHAEYRLFEGHWFLSFVWGVMHGQPANVAFIHAVTPTCGNRRVLSHLLDSLSIRPGIRQGILRSWKGPIATEVGKTHTHPKAAGLRTGVRRSFVKLADDLGLRYYDVSYGKDVREGDSGTRLYYCNHDLDKTFKFDELTRKDLMVMVDVDYYVDLPMYLAAGVPLALFTAVPESAAGHVDNGTFYMKDDMYYLNIDGGSSYHHYLWDHSRADCSVLDCDNNLVVYDIENHRLADHHRRVIFYIPKCIVPNGVWQDIGLRPEPPQRLHVSFGSTTVLKVRGLSDPPSTHYSFSPGGTECSFTIRESTLFSVLVRMNEATTLGGPGVIVRNLNSDKFPGDVEFAATCIFRLYQENPDILQRFAAASYVCPSSVVNSVAPPPRVDEFTPASTPPGPMGKSGAAAIHAPLVNAPAVVPLRNRSNEADTIEKRLDAVRNDKVPHPVYNEYAHQFLTQLIRNPGHGMSESLPQVLAKQDLRAQKLRNAAELPCYGTAEAFKVKAFQKAEPYAKVGPPRNISTVPTGHCLALSGFTYAMKRDLLAMPWFAPGKGPKDITHRARDIADSSDHVICRDFSKFDGTISEWLYRHVTRPACALWVHPNERGDFLRLLDEETNAPGVTNTGLRYNTRYTRLSGSPVTSDHNTIINAFVTYCAARLSGRSNQQAFECLGIYLGDDALDSGLVDGKYHIQACEDLGLKVKLDEVKRGHAVGFLGRYFTDPWSSDDTLQDPVRTLGKLHIAFPGNVPLNVAACNKATGYCVTDLNTPVIGTWARCVLRLCHDAGIQADMNSLDWYDREKFSRSWPQNDLRRIREVFDELTGISGKAIAEFEKVCEHAKSFSDIKFCFDILDKVPPPPPGYLVNGDPPVDLRPASDLSPDVTRAVSIPPVAVSCAPSVVSAVSPPARALGPVPVAMAAVPSTPIVAPAIPVPARILGSAPVRGMAVHRAPIVPARRFQGPVSVRGPLRSRLTCVRRPLS